MAFVARRGNLFVVRAAVAVLFAGAFGMAFGDFGSSGLQEYARRADAFLITIGYCQLACVLLLGPAYISDSFASEKARKTFDLLRITRLSSREIVLSKFTPRVLLVLTHASAGFGIIALVALWGSIGLERWVGLTLLIAASAISSGSIAMAVAVLSRSRHGATLIAYGLIGSLFLGPLVLEWGTVANAPVVPNATATAIGEAVLTVNPFYVLGVVMEPSRARWSVGQCVATATFLGSHALISAGAIAIAIFGLGRSERWGTAAPARARRRRVAPVADDPMRWKECRLPARRRVLALNLGLLAAVGVSLAARFDGAGNVQNLGGLLMIGLLVLQIAVLVVIALRGVASISRERHDNTWDSLLGSPLRPEEIVRAKISGARAGILDLALLAVPPWIAGWLLGAVRIEGLLGLAVNLWMFSWTLAAMGVWAALNPKRSARSVVIVLCVLFAPISIGAPAILIVPLAMLLLPMPVVLILLIPLLAPLGLFAVFLFVMSPMTLMIVVACGSLESIPFDLLLLFAIWVFMSTMVNSAIGGFFESAAIEYFDAWTGRTRSPVPPLVYREVQPQGPSRSQAGQDFDGAQASRRSTDSAEIPNE